MELPKRKRIRMVGYDYSTPARYFVTICTHNKEKMLSKIDVGDDAFIVPMTELTNYGKICDKYLNNINKKYENIEVEKYVIMPNHIHMIVIINGTMKASSPTIGLESVVRSFKGMVTKETGKSIWQRSYYDHVIRNENDYKNIWNYIESNPGKWADDCYYI